MKRITRRVQALNERAAELTASAAQIPQRVAELREAAQATTSELRSLKSGLQINVPDLLIKREDELSRAIAELAAHAPVFAEAGFILDGLDLEISPLQQVIVQLLHHRDVETLHLQPLVQRHQADKYVRAILSAIVKARGVVETIRIPGLDYYKLTVAIGPVPTVRLCWRERPEEIEPSVSDITHEPNSAEPIGVPAMSSGSFFDTPPSLPPLRRSSSARQSGQSAPPPLKPAPEPGVPPLPSAPVDPLARFKVMPKKW